MSQSSSSDDFLRRTGLRAEEVFYAPWRRPLAPAINPPAFDAQACIKRLARVRSDEYGVRVEWHRARLQWPMTRQEARFWLAAFQYYERDHSQPISHHDSPRQLGERIVEKIDLDGSVQWAQIDRAFDRLSSLMLSSDRMLVLSCLFDPEELAEALFRPPRAKPFKDELINLAIGAAPYLMPLLSDDQIDSLRSRLDRPDLTGAPGILAAAIGLYDAVERRVAGWQDGDLADSSAGHHFAVLCGLGDGETLSRERARLSQSLREPWQVVGWLAHRDVYDLEPIRESLKALKRKKLLLEPMVEVLIRGDAPELAPLFLHLMLDSPAAKTARRWLREHPRSSLLGLAPILGRPSTAANAAESLLRGLIDEYAELSAEVLEELSPELASRLSALANPRGVGFEASREMPASLRLAFSQLPAKVKRKRPPKWLELAALPPLVTSGARLDAEQIRLVLALLRESLLDQGQVHPLVTLLATEADAVSRDDFAVELFEQWQHAGAPGTDKWALHALAHLGGDRAVLSLMPKIEQWRARLQHQRTAQGVRTAVALGSRSDSAGDMAVMHLDRILRTTKRPSLRRQSDEALETIADARGLHREELMDRAIPDLGLTPLGGYTVDYGQRRFELILGEDLKPKVRDEKGKVLANPPKPGKRDAATAEPARQAWMILKKQLQQVITIQGQRLEASMVQARRWRHADFSRWMVDHPLMGLLVRRLVWTSYEENQVASTFRISAEGERLDASDEVIELEPERIVGVVHRLDLDEATRAAWQGLMADYEIVAPFPQLGRRVFTLIENEAKGSYLKRFCPAHAPSETLIFGLERLGWRRGPLSDGMFVHKFAKPFYGHGLSAILDGSMDGSVIAIGSGRGAAGQIDGVLFVPGIFHRLDEEGSPQDRLQSLRLSDVPPVVISEVLVDLELMAQKAA